VAGIRIYDELGIWQVLFFSSVVPRCFDRLGSRAVALERCAGHKLKPLDCLGTNRSEVLLQQMAGRLAANPS
jgi:hypothetical protein